MSWLHPSCYTPNAKHFLESLLIEFFHLLQRVWNKTKIQIATMQSHNLIWLQPHDQAALCSMLFILRIAYTIVLSPDSLQLERTTWLQQTLAVHSFPDARAWEWDQPLLRWFKKLQIVTEFITVAPTPHCYNSYLGVTCIQGYRDSSLTQIPPGRRSGWAFSGNDTTCNNAPLRFLLDHSWMLAA